MTQITSSGSSGTAMFDVAFWIVLGIGLVVLLWMAFLRALDFD
jgi:hypothetical protein